MAFKTKGKPKKPYGPKFSDVRKKLTESANTAAQEAATDYAHKALGEFQTRIEMQDFRSFQFTFYPESGTNLSPGWLARKRAAGADERTMVATGHYLNSMQVFKTQGKSAEGKLMKGVTIRIGFHPSAKARDLEGEIVPLLLKHLAAVHEYGSAKANVPARPHWRPQMARMKERGNKTASDMRRHVARQVRQALRNL